MPPVPEACGAARGATHRARGRTVCTVGGAVGTVVRTAAGSALSRQICSAWAERRENSGPTRRSVKGGHVLGSLPRQRPVLGTLGRVLLVLDPSRAVLVGGPGRDRFCPVRGHIRDGDPPAPVHLPAGRRPPLEALAWGVGGHAQDARARPRRGGGASSSWWWRPSGLRTLGTGPGLRPVPSGTRPSGTSVRKAPAWRRECVRPRGPRPRTPPGRPPRPGAGRVPRLGTPPGAARQAFLRPPDHHDRRPSPVWYT